MINGIEAADDGLCCLVAGVEVSEVAGAVHIGVG